MNEFSHKLVSVTVATVVAYFGFQSLDLALGLYQTSTYFTISWYMFAFHIFWLLFIFDLHFKHTGHVEHHGQYFEGVGLFWQAFKSRVRHFYHWTFVRRYLNYLILPSVLFWSVIVLMYLNPFHALFKDALIIMTTAALSVTYWYFKEAFSHHMELQSTGLKVLSLVKLFGAYLAFTSIIAVGWYFGLSLAVLFPLVFIISFLLMYQNLMQHRLLAAGTHPLMVMFSSLVALVFVIVFQTWNVNYYTAGLMIVVVYTIGWSITYKFLDNELSWGMFWEHVFMLIVLISVILSTHDFQGRI